MPEFFAFGALMLGALFAVAGLIRLISAAILLTADERLARAGLRQALLALAIGLLLASLGAALLLEQKEWLLDRLAPG